MATQLERSIATVEHPDSNRPQDAATQGLHECFALQHGGNELDEPAATAGDVDAAVWVAYGRLDIGRSQESARASLEQPGRRQGVQGLAAGDNEGWRRLIRQFDDRDAAVWAYFGTFSAVAPYHSIEHPLLPVPLPDVREPSVWRRLLRQYDDWNAEMMMRIIECESHGDENAVSPDGQNVGAFQLNVVHGFSYEDATDPAISTALAHDVWLSQGYGAWTCWG